MRVDKNYIIPCNATFFRSLIARIFFFFFFIGGTSSIIARSPMRHGTHKTFVSVTDRKPNIIISRVFMSCDSHMCFEFSSATCTPFRALFVKGSGLHSYRSGLQTYIPLYFSLGFGNYMYACKINWKKVGRSILPSLGRKLFILLFISADQCTIWLDEEKNVVEWFGKSETYWSNEWWYNNCYVSSMWCEHFRIWTVLKKT